jgi:hypothetical protein
MNSKLIDFRLSSARKINSHKSLPFFPKLRKTVPGQDLRGFLIHDVHPFYEKDKGRKKNE